MENGSAKGAFAISPDNKLVLATSGELEPGAVRFSTEQELAAVSADWPVGALVDLWNRLPGVTRVRKFTDRATALRRIWAALQSQAKPPARSKPTAARAMPAPREPKRGSVQTSQDSKTDQVIALLKRPSGATMKELMALTGWQAHSVRGFLSAQLAKKRRLRVKSFKRDGERVYRLRVRS